MHAETRTLWHLCALLRLLKGKWVMAVCTLASEGARLAIPVLTCLLVDRLGRGEAIGWLLAGLIAAEGGSLLVSYCRSQLETLYFTHFDAAVVLAYWRDICSLDLNDFSRHSVGMWLGKVCCDAKLVTTALRQVFDVALGFALFCLGSLTIILWRAPLLGVLFLLALGGGWCVCHVFRRHLNHATKQMRRATYRFQRFLYGIIRMHSLLKVFGVTPPYNLRLQAMSAYSVARDTQLALLEANNRLCLELALWLARMGVFGGYVYCVAAGRCTLGEMIAATLLTTQMLQGIQSLMSAFPSFTKGREALAEIRTTLAPQPTLAPLPPAAPQPCPREALIDCSALSFAYTPGRDVICNFSASFKRGDFCVFLGHNGSGKSTLAKLLLQLLRPTAGTIAYAPALQVGWIPQQADIQDDSILENIRLRSPAISEAEVAKAVDFCGLSRWIEQLPGGLHARLAEGKLSGGQLQLISIARALVRKPNCLIIDEVTNNLDIVMKQTIYRVLRHCAANRLVILISHDLESIQLANRLFLFEQAHIREMSPAAFTPEQLLNATLAR